MQKWDASTYTGDWHDSLIMKPRIEMWQLSYQVSLTRKGSIVWHYSFLSFDCLFLVLALSCHFVSFWMFYNEKLTLSFPWTISQRSLKTELSWNGVWLFNHVKYSCMLGVTSCVTCYVIFNHTSFCYIVDSVFFQKMVDDFPTDS